MSDEPKKDLYYQIIPRPGEAIWKHSVLGFQSHSRVEMGQQIPGEMVMLDPNGLGQYVIKASLPRYAECRKAMELKMERENHEGQPPRIVGPFGSQNEAIVALDKLRPKTSDELLAVATKEKSALEQRVKELEAKLAK